MEGQCGLKTVTIGGVKIDLPIVESMLDEVLKVDYTADGLRLAYDKYIKGKYKISPEEWSKWYNNTAAEIGEYLAKDVSNEDVAGKGNVTEDSKKLTKYLNFKGYTATQSGAKNVLNYKTLKALKGLRQTVKQNGALSAAEIAAQLNNIERAIDLNKTANRLKKGQTNIKKKIGKVFAGKLDDYTALTLAMSLDIDKVADNSQLVAYAEIYDRLNRQDVDFTDFGDIVQKALALIEAMDNTEQAKIEEANDVLLGDTDNTKDVLIAKVIEELKLENLKGNIAEYFQQRFLDVVKNLNPETLSVLTKRELATILNGLEGIKYGTVTSKFAEIMTKIRVKNGIADIYKAVKSSKKPLNALQIALADISEGFQDIFGIKGGIQKQNAIAKNLKKNTAYKTDETLDIKGTPIADLIVFPLSRAQEQMDDYNRKWAEEAEILTNKHKAFFGLNRNKRNRLMSLISLYLIQREYESNPGSKYVTSANDEIRNIAKNYRRTDNYNELGVAELQSMQKEYSNPDGTWKLDKLFKDIGQPGRDIVDFNDRASLDALEKIGVIAVRRGSPPPWLKNYVHRSRISLETGGDILQEATRKGLLEGKTLPGVYIARQTPGKSLARLSDPLNNINKGLESVSLDYFMGETITDVQKMLAGASELAENSGDEQAALIAIGIEQKITDDIIRNVTNTTTVPSKLQNTFNNLVKYSYYAQLASVPRMASEGVSNLAFALLHQPQAFFNGLQNELVWDSSKGVQVALATGSSSVNKMFGQGTSPHFEKTYWTSTSRFTKLKHLSPGAASIATASDWISHSWVVGGSKDLATRVADGLLSSPDKAITKPLFFGVLTTEFKRLAGVDLDIDLLIADTKEGIKYRLDNEENIALARKKADINVIQAGATTNPWLGISNMQYDARQSDIQNALRAVQYYMLRFSLFEFSSAQTAVKDIMGNGNGTTADGWALMGAIVGRMAIYAPIYATLTKMMINMFGLGEDEDDDLGFLADLRYGFLGSLLQLGLMRNMSLLGREGIGFAIEAFNEEYLEGLRNGEEFDPFKHSLVFRVIKDKDFSRRKGVWGFASKLTGPLRPVLDDLDRIIKFGTPADLAAFFLTYQGRMILPPKDVSRLVKTMNWQQYNETKNK